MKEQEVVLVNENDEVVGAMPKMEAHQKGLLHRAFSVFIFDSKGRMLLQQRAAEKYHGAHLWTNACCSHPYPGERTEDAAKRRLKEELGFGVKLHEIFSFTYYAKVENDLIEHEFDHVFLSKRTSLPSLNRAIPKPVLAIPDITTSGSIEPKRAARYRPPNTLVRSITAFRAIGGEKY